MPYSPEIYDNKLSEYFSLSPDHTPIDKQVHALFNTFAKAQQHPYVVECSFKLYEEKLIGARRVQYWFNDYPARVINAFPPLLHEFEKLGFSFNRTLLNILWQHMDVKHLSRFVIGYDLRPDIGNSRIELWYQIENQAPLVDQVLAHHGSNQLVDQIIDKKDVPIGVDLNYNSTTKFKLYPYFNAQTFNNNYTDAAGHTEPVFSTAIIEFFKLVRRAYPSFSDKDLARILHVEFHDAEWFTKTWLNNPTLNKLVEKIEHIEWENVFIGMLEKEVEQKNVKRLNFYY